MSPRVATVTLRCGTCLRLSPLRECTSQLGRRPARHPLADGGAAGTPEGVGQVCKSTLSVDPRLSLSPVRVFVPSLWEQGL
jgi:hypothetical protein